MLSLSKKILLIFLCLLAAYFLYTQKYTQKIKKSPEVLKKEINKNNKITPRIYKKFRIKNDVQKKIIPLRKFMKTQIK